MSCKIYVGDIGKNFDINLRASDLSVNLSDVTDISLTFNKPNKDSLTVTPNILVPASGMLRYVFASGDLDVAGLWRYQVDYETIISHRSSNISMFKVYENL